MVSRGKDHPAQLIQIRAGRAGGCRNLCADPRKDLRGLVQVARLMGEHGKATAAQAGRFQLPLDQKAQHMGGHGGLFAPASAFVEAAVDDAALIGFAADRAQSVSGRLSHHQVSAPPV
jgi:hypothetical protein